MAEITFYKRALLRFKNQAEKTFRRGMDWYRRSHDNIKDFGKEIMDWVSEYKWAIIITIGIVVFLAVTVIFFIDLFNSKIEDAAKVGVGAIVGAPMIGLVVGAVSALAAYPLLWLLYAVLMGMIYLLLFTPILLGAIFYGIYLVLLVLGQFLLLLPLTVMVLMERLWLLWRKIFYTCPNRECSYRGLPIHVCSKCGKNHYKLWPNIYGLLFHPCDCGKKLPTLDLLGRKQLTRLCAECNIRLSDEIGKLPEELVALVGGPDVGKTNFLLKSTQRLLNGKNCKTGLNAELIVPSQKQELSWGIENLEKGITPEKTLRTHTMAYLLGLNRQSRKSLLYYYDAAGEEFTTIKKAGKHENIKHLDGLLLLVDPFCLEGLKHKAAAEDEGLKASKESLEDIVTSIIVSLRKAHLNRNNLYSLPLAIVITKADAPSVQAILGDVSKELPTSEQCERALLQWGARNSLQLLRQNFQTLRFFACSALGRSPGNNSGKPFNDYGIMEPLQWILNV